MVEDMENTMEVGTIVKLKVNCMDNEPGAVGICYEDYEFGSSFIFANGRYDGFNIKEQGMFLEEWRFSDYYSRYEFRNVIQLEKDFRKGFFNEMHDWE